MYILYVHVHVVFIIEYNDAIVIEKNRSLSNMRLSGFALFGEEIAAEVCPSILATPCTRAKRRGTVLEN